MLEQRGYSISTNNEEHIIATKREGKIRRKICVFKYITEKLNVDAIKKYMNDLHDLKSKHCIIICIDGITPPTKQMVNTSVDVKIEVFYESDLMVNKTKHRLVPVHIPLGKDESTKFKEKYGTQIPRLLKTDAICRFYNFTRGQIIKVIRPNGFVSYRIVK